MKNLQYTNLISIGIFQQAGRFLRRNNTRDFSAVPRLELLSYEPVRFYPYYGNRCESYRGSAFSSEASLEQASTKMIELNLQDIVVLPQAR